MSLARSQRRALKKQKNDAIEKTLKHGFQPDQTLLQRQTIALAAHLIGILGGNSFRRASDATEAAMRVLERSNKTYPFPGLACKKGCSYCCYLFASASAPELLLIRRVIEALPSQSRNLIIKQIEDAPRLDEEGRWANVIACSLLISAECSVYRARPFNCRRVTSVNVKECISTFERTDDATDEVPYPAVPMMFADSAKFALSAALYAHKLSYHSYDINSAIKILMSIENAEARWLAGENIFSGAIIDGPEIIDEDHPYDAYIIEIAEIASQ